MRPRTLVAGVACLALVACGAAQVVVSPGAPSEPSVAVVVASPTPSPSLSASPAPSPTPSVKPSSPATESSTWESADMSAAIPLVNKDYRLQGSYVFKGTGAWGLTADTNAAVLKLISAARADGVKMTVRSGYRSYAAQKTAYENALRTYSSVDQAKLYNAPPGASEHQTGLAVDMWDGVTRGYAFRGTAVDKWLAANAYKYGFIIRYPKDKTAITGYMDEPWHLRYVGAEVAATFGPNNTLALEEYLGVK